MDQCGSYWVGFALLIMEAIRAITRRRANPPLKGGFQRWFGLEYSELHSLLFFFIFSHKNIRFINIFKANFMFL